jgi:hypothetical protein
MPKKKPSLHFKQQSSVYSDKVDVTNNTLSGCELDVVRFVRHHQPRPHAKLVDLMLLLDNCYWPQEQVKTTQQLSE